MPRVAQFQSFNFEKTMVASPAWTDAQDREGSRLLKSSFFSAHNLCCEVVDLVDPEQLRLHLTHLHSLLLVTHLPTLHFSNLRCCRLSTLHQAAVEGWKSWCHDQTNWSGACWEVLIVVEAEDCRAAEERVVHVNVASIVVRVGVPETPSNHPC